MKNVFIRIAITAAALTLAFCSRKTPPVYEATTDRLHQGSLYYSQSDCVNCHGPAWDGKGPDAARLGKLGIVPTDFTKVDPSKSPADYFKAITGPSLAFVSLAGKVQSEEGKKEVERLKTAHAYLTYTDAGRWAIANFLFSLNPEALDKDEAKREESLERGAKETSEAYASSRNWAYGYSLDSNPVPDISAMIQKTALSDVLPAALVSEERRRIVSEGGDGAELYANNCASCHGSFGEGRSTNRFGLTNENRDNRLRAALVSTIDLGRSTSIGSPDALKKGHAHPGQMLPSFENFTREDWQDISNFISKLAGK